MLISAMPSSKGAPAHLLEEWRRGSFELIVSEALINELRRALGYPKLRRYIGPEQAGEFVGWLVASATTADPPSSVPKSAHSADPGDDYLLALAEATNALLVSGDTDLLDLRAAALPIYTPAEFLKLAGG